MKLEDMTHDQLVAALREERAAHYDTLSRLERMEDRYKMANKMTKCYIDEFEARGLMYIPKVEK